jgi:hypothetical protein
MNRLLAASTTTVRCLSALRTARVAQTAPFLLQLRQGLDFAIDFEFIMIAAFLLAGWWL